MIFTAVYKNGNIHVVEGVAEVSSRLNLGQDDIRLRVTLKDESEPNVILASELAQWDLRTDMGAQVLNIELRDE